MIKNSRKICLWGSIILYIYELELNQNILKQQSCLNEGYNYMFIIDKDYTEIEKLLTKI